MRKDTTQKRVKSLIDKQGQSPRKDWKEKLLQVAGGCRDTLSSCTGSFRTDGMASRHRPRNGQANRVVWSRDRGQRRIGQHKTTIESETFKRIYLCGFKASGNRRSRRSGAGSAVTSFDANPDASTVPDTDSEIPTPINNPKFTGTVEFAPFRKEYRYKTSGGNDTAWKKAADITFDERQYSGAAFEVSVLDTLSGWGTNANLKRVTFYVSATRSGVVLNDRDKGHVSGPTADYVRLVKKSTGVFELHVRQIANWRHIEFTIRAVSASKETITYIDSPVNGSSSGTVYMPVPNPTPTPAPTPITIPTPRPCPFRTRLECASYGALRPTPTPRPSSMLTPLPTLTPRPSCNANQDEILACELSGSEWDHEFCKCGVSVK